jgi:hypothetical protein
MLVQVGAIVLGIVGVNVIFWVVVLQWKKRSERLSPIVIDDEGDNVLESKQAAYHGTFDVENFRIFSNGLFAKGAGMMRLTKKYIVFKKKLSRKSVIIPLRYIVKMGMETHPRQKKPLLNIHWKNGNVELVSRFALHDSQMPEVWIQRIENITSNG